MLQRTSIGLFLLLSCYSFRSEGITGNDIQFDYQSVFIEKVKFENFSIAANYYSLIENFTRCQPTTTAKRKPDNEELIRYARNTPSYFFTVYQGDQVVYVITLLQRTDEAESDFSYHVINTHNQISIEMPCSFDAQITEKRSREICSISKGKVLPPSRTKKNQMLLHDKIYYTIQSYDSVLVEVSRMADELINPPPEEYGFSEDFIRSETIGGKLDFRISLRDDDRQLYLVSGTAFDRNSFAILLWGIAVRKMSVKSSRKAIQLWEDINQRSLTKLEKKALVTGFLTEYI